MKNLALVLAFCVLGLYSAAQIKPSVHSYTALTIDGQKISLSKYAGKKIMLVNTASYCAYTPQFAKLEELYKAYKQYNFEILGFPCNDFGGQDPGKDSTINVFCTGNYGVTFQMMGKVAIVAGDTAPIYKWLQRKNMNGAQDISVDWNFNKFLIDECGTWVNHYTSTMVPTDAAIKNWILSPTCVTTGLEGESTEKMFRVVSANPATSFIDLSFSEEAMRPGKIILFSTDGKKIMELETEFSSNPKSIDVSELPPGVYVLTVSSGAIRSQQRVIILR